MKKIVTFQGKKTQGPAPALTVGRLYEVIEEQERYGELMYLIVNDSGNKKWYPPVHFFEGTPAPTPKEIALAFARYLEFYCIRQNPTEGDRWYGYGKPGLPLEAHYNEFLAEYTAGYFKQQS